MIGGVQPLPVAPEIIALTELSSPETGALDPGDARAVAGAPTRARIAAFSAAAALLVWTPALVLAWREWGALASHLRFGADYISFYAASVLTLEGAPARVYDLAVHNAIQKRLFPESGYSWFFYPPVYLLVCWPLALAPYFVSLGAWLAVTFAAWFAMARRLAPAFVGVAPFVVFPAVMMNATHGQNAFLTCALMGAGVMCLQRRSLVAGLLFGALAFKPQIGILIPVLLIAGGHWRAFFAAAATVAGLCLASVAAFGVETWSAYLDALPQGRRVMEDGLFGLEKLQSVFAMVRIAGASVETAYAAQAAVALTVAALLAYVTARSRDALA